MFYTVEQLQNVHIKTTDGKRAFNIEQLTITEGSVQCVLKKRNDNIIKWVEISGLKGDGYQFIVDYCSYTHVNGKITIKNICEKEIKGELRRDGEQIAIIKIFFNYEYFSYI
nr:hypothetical protein [Pieris rapae granulovirus]